MEQPKKKNGNTPREVDPSRDMIEIDDDTLEQVTGGGLRIPGIHQKVGIRTENGQKHPVYKNSLNGETFVDYPNGVRKYFSGAGSDFFTGRNFQLHQTKFDES